MLALLFCHFALATVVIWRTAQQPSPMHEVAGKTVPALAVFILLILAGSFIHLWRRGLPAKNALGKLFIEPLWWITWYPKPLRRRANIWDRLPVEVQRLRAALGALAVGAILIGGPMTMYILSNSDYYWHRSIALRWLSHISFVATNIVVASMLLFMWFVPMRLRRRGLSALEARRFAYEAPLSRRPFWSRPAVAALLVSGRHASAGSAAAGMSTAASNAETAEPSIGTVRDDARDKTS
jgi:hypothetical protein